MDKVLDWIHVNKRWLGFLVAGAGLALNQAGHHAWGDWILAGGSIAGLGVLPNGPNPKVDADAPKVP